MGTVASEVRTNTLALHPGSYHIIPELCEKGHTFSIGVYGVCVEMCQQLSHHSLYHYMRVTSLLWAGSPRVGLQLSDSKGLYLSGSSELPWKLLFFFFFFLSFWGKRDSENGITAEDLKFGNFPRRVAWKNLIPFFTGFKDGGRGHKPRTQVATRG